MEKKVKCHRCNYVWVTKSEERRLTCNNCGTSVIVKKNIPIEELKSRANEMNKQRGFKDENK